MPSRPLALVLLLGLAACTTTTPPSPTATRTPSPAATAIATATQTATPAPTPLPPNKLGVHLLLDDGRNAWPVALWPEHMRYARRAVGAGGGGPPTPSEG